MNIEQLATDLIAAKAAEAAANKKRVAIEEQIITMLGHKDEGSQTTELTNGLKITVTGKMTYSADMPALMQLCGDLPENMRPIKTKVELDQTGLKYLKNNEAEIWKHLSIAITMKPAKTSVEIKA